MKECMNHSLWYSFFIIAGTLSANPTGEQVVIGEAAFDRTQENQLHITQSSDRARIHWDSFSINENEVTHFAQPSSESVVVNMVTGQEMSKLYGTLESNGHIILINPHGMIQGENGTINAASFLFSAKDVCLEAKEGQCLAVDLSAAIHREERVDALEVQRVVDRVFLVEDKGTPFFAAFSLFGFSGGTDDTIGTFSVGESADLINDALIAEQQLRTEIPERLWVQEFSFLFDRSAFKSHLKEMIRHKNNQVGFSLGKSRDYFLQATMSGENIRLLDRYQEFEQSPFWRTPDMMERLEWLEQ